MKGRAPLLTASATLIALAVLAAIPSGRAAGESAATFYRDKTVNLIVSAGAGGGYDTFARTLAAHLGRHIPGSPAIVVQNMTGAGGLRAALYLDNVAPNDGSVIAMVQSTALISALLGSGGVKLDPARFTWIGNMSREFSLCVSWHTSRIRTAQDLFEKEFVVGSSGAGTSMETYPNIINSLFGSHIKIISGYKGGASVLIAMERGEVDGRCGASLATYKAVRPNWVRDHKINYLLQTSLQKDPDLPDAPWLMDYVKTDEQRAILELVLAPRLIQRPVLAPPNIPQDRVKALRDAFEATLADPEFRKEAKTRRLDISPSSAAHIKALIDRLARTPRSIRNKAAQLLKKHK
jgi:tripartite-type tricarboxylate transporter receptor subunit TctC